MQLDGSTFGFQERHRFDLVRAVWHVLEPERVPEWRALEDFAWALVVSGNLHANRQVRPSLQEDPDDRKTRILVLSHRVEHRSLSADPSIVDGRGGVDVGAEIEQQADSFQTLVLSRHVQ